MGAQGQIPKAGSQRMIVICFVNEGHSRLREHTCAKARRSEFMCASLRVIEVRRKRK